MLRPRNLSFKYNFPASTDNYHRTGYPASQLLNAYSTEHGSFNYR